MSQVSEVIRSYQYPVLEDGNLSYPNGVYMVEVTPQADGVSVVIHHKIQGAPLIDKLLMEQKAKFGCLVSVPLTGYRRLHLSDDEYQKVVWDVNVVGEPPMLRPIVVAIEDFTCVLGPSDGVCVEWQAQNVSVKRGSRLAVRGYLKAYSSLNELLEIVKDQSLLPGSFEVKGSSEEGYYFRVSVAKDLYDFLQNPGGYNEHRGSILSHIASRCFEILRQDFGQSDEEDEGGLEWMQHRNLVALSDVLKRNNLEIWDEEGFVADRVATRLYPHKPPQVEFDV